MPEGHGSSESIGLCPHGRLPGICKECLGTDTSVETQEEIREKAKKIGSSAAKELWNQLEEEGQDPKEYIYDMVMVLGAGFREGKPDKLNIESRMRLNAAAQLYLEGRARMICVTGGPALSEKWKDYGSLADLGKTYLMEKFGIPEGDIILEDRSDATHGNLAYGLREMYQDDLPVGKFAIVSTNYHLNRAREMAKRSGIESDFLPAESLLMRRSKHYHKFVERWLEYAQKAGLEENEVAKLADPKYWDDRAAYFETPLDKEPEKFDVSQSVAETAARLAASGGAEGVQTDAF